MTFKAMILLMLLVSFQAVAADYSSASSNPHKSLISAMDSDIHSVEHTGSLSPCDESEGMDCISVSGEAHCSSGPVIVFNADLDLSLSISSLTHSYAPVEYQSVYLDLLNPPPSYFS